MKTFLVAYFTEEDSPPVFERMTREEIEHKFKTMQLTHDVAIIDGELINGFNQKVDLKQLKYWENK